MIGGRENVGGLPAWTDGGSGAELGCWCASGVSNLKEGEVEGCLPLVDVSDA